MKVAIVSPAPDSDEIGVVADRLECSTEAALVAVLRVYCEIQPLTDSTGFLKMPRAAGWVDFLASRPGVFDAMAAADLIREVDGGIEIPIEFLSFENKSKAGRNARARDRRSSRPATTRANRDRPTTPAGAAKEPDDPLRPPKKPIAEVAGMKVWGGVNKNGQFYAKIDGSECTRNHGGEHKTKPIFATINPEPGCWEPENVLKELLTSARDAGPALGKGTTSPSPAQIREAIEGLRGAAWRSVAHTARSVAQRGAACATFSSESDVCPQKIGTNDTPSDAGPALTVITSNDDKDHYHCKGDREAEGTFEPGEDGQPGASGESLAFSDGAAREAANRLRAVEAARQGRFFDRLREGGSRVSLGKAIEAMVEAVGWSATEHQMLEAHRRGVAFVGDVKKITIVGGDNYAGIGAKVSEDDLRRVLREARVNAEGSRPENGTGTPESFP